MIRDKLEEALMRCSAWERDACIALAQDDQESARAVLSNIIDFATLKLQNLMDLYAILQEKGAYSAIPEFEHYADCLRRFIQCAVEQLSIYK